MDKLYKIGLVVSNLIFPLVGSSPNFLIKPNIE
jgi:hypothetical protein